MSNKNIQIIKHNHQYGDGSLEISYDTKLGKVTVFKAELKLRQDLGELHEIQGKLFISKQGYDRLNTIANVNVFPYPQEIMIEGRLERNPYIFINPTTRLVERIIGSYWGFAISPVGNFQVATATLNYDLSAYSQQKLIKLLKKNPHVFKMGIPELCPFCPQEQTFKGDDGVYKAIDKSNNKTYIYKILDAGDGVWCDQTHNEYIEFLEESRDRIKFAERTATSILKRNIIKEIIGKSRLKHISGSLDQKNAVCSVTVYGYKHILERDDVMKLIDQASKGELRNAEFVTVNTNVAEDAEFEEIIKEEKELEQGESVPEIKPNNLPEINPIEDKEIETKTKPVEPPIELRSKLKIINSLSKKYMKKMEKKDQEEFNEWINSDKINLESCDYWIKKFGNVSLK